MLNAIFLNPNLSRGSVLQRHSSGLRVNCDKDDAAGLPIATRMEAQSWRKSLGSLARRKLLANN
ncbi:hypothetical protein [Dechloromonas sp. TW-R-39-2]|uniref:flagellin N-terminal helical domain-containing protein n=1 Tax=Dechloromonas sp. TW-R-39-2 TaxID=2654218 RepID=UPI003530142D